MTTDIARVRKGKKSWYDLPEGERSRLQRLKVGKSRAQRLERARRRSLRPKVVNLDRVGLSRVQRHVMDSAKRCQILQVELDALEDKQRRRWNRREIIECAILRLEGVLRRKLEELVERVPLYRERVAKALDYEPVDEHASQRNGNVGAVYPRRSKSLTSLGSFKSSQRTTNGTTG